tara:strand:- start:14 stop:781 length:768 start_codon:yes stop_codon:yes gene_type:complete
MYPVGPFLSGEVKNNDTFYKGGGFEPVMTADQVDSMASSMKSYLEPACGKEEAILQARQVARFAELGGGQQVQARGGGSEECAKKAWVILSIDPDRARPSRELVTTFFHEVFHTVQARSSQPCNYSGAPADDDQFWIHEAGATFFALEMAAELGNFNSDLLWWDHMDTVSSYLDQYRFDLEDPGIAEKGAIALRLLAERGQLETSEVMDGSLYQNCGGQPEAFSPQNLQVAKDYWSDYSEVGAFDFRFSETALTQ